MNWKTFTLITFLAAVLMLSGCPTDGEGNGGTGGNGTGGIPAGKTDLEYFVELSDKVAGLKSLNEYKMDISGKSWMDYDSGNPSEGLMESTMSLAKKGNNIKMGFSFLEMSSNVYLWNSQYFSCVEMEGEMECQKAEAGSNEAAQFDESINLLFTSQTQILMESIGRENLHFKDVFNISSKGQKTLNGRTCQEFSLELNLAGLAAASGTSMEEIEAEMPLSSLTTCLDAEYGLAVEQESIMDDSISGATIRTLTEINLSFNVTEAEMTPPQEAFS